MSGCGNPLGAGPVAMSGWAEPAPSWDGNRWPFPFIAERMVAGGFTLRAAIC